MVLGLVVIFAGGAHAASTTTPAPTGPEGSITLGLSSLGDEILYPPHASGTTHANVLAPIFDYMIRFNLDMNLVPGLLSGWELAPDGKSLIYSLRKGIKFHNGENLTAEDLKFSLDEYASKDAAYGTLRNAYERSEIVDDYTVQVFTNGPQPYFTYLNSPQISNQGTVLPKDYVDKVGIDTFKLHPVGTGPFKFVRHIPGDSIEYEALDEHWRQVARFKDLKVILIPEETTRVAMLKTGEADVIDIGMESHADLSKEAAYKTYIMDSMTPMILLTGALHPDAAGMPTADIRVRKALSLAINRAELGDTFFYGKLGPVSPPFLNPFVADVDNDYWQDYAANVYRYDLKEAKQLMKEAGYSDGFEIDLWSYSARGAAYLPKMAEIVQAYWREIGVKANIVATDFGTFKKHRKGPGPKLVGQAAVYRYHGTNPLTSTHLQIGFHSENGPYTMLSKSRPDLDTLIDLSFQEMDTAKRKALIKKFIEETVDLYTSLQIGTAPSMCALGPKVDVVDIPRVWSGLALYPEFYIHRGK